MKYPAGLYTGKADRQFLALYNHYPDVFVKPPADFDAKHVAHISYEYGRKGGGIDIFQLDKGENPERIAKLTTNVIRNGRGYFLTKNTWRTQYQTHLSDRDVRKTTSMHNVNIQILGGLPEAIKREAINSALTDIFDYCEGVEAKKRREPEYAVVDRIIPRTRVKHIDPETMLTLGKQEYNPFCLFKANTDAGQGCISSFLPEENAYFDGEFFVGYFSSPWGECVYCYAGEDHKCYPKTLYTFDKKRLEEELRGGFILDRDTGETLGRPVEVLRFGKRTESYSRFTRDYFLNTLEACVDTGTRGVIPAKMLPFDLEILGLAKKTNSSLLFSVSGRDNDRFEVGACANGFPNEVRIENAIKYNENGARVIIYLNVTNPAQLNEEQWRIINLAEKRGIPVQILPLRYQRIDVMEAMTGLSWTEAKTGQINIFERDERRVGTSYHEGQRLIPLIRTMDPLLMSKIGDNKGSICMCHHDNQQTFCGGCGIAPGGITGKLGEVKRKEDKRTRWVKKNAKKNQELIDRTQIKLFEEEESL